MNLSVQKIEDMLTAARVRVSPVRILVLRELDAASGPLSGQDIEDALQTVDRSSITRSLAIFAENGLVHRVDDGSGAVKYELCRCGAHTEKDADVHPHFHCLECGKTYCIDNQPIPDIVLPEGFVAQSVNYVISGVCPACSGSDCDS